MLHASKTLAMTMVDLFEDSKKIEAVKAEYKQRKGDAVYKGLLPDGPPPLTKK
jgi:aminobenzoyl-glutamate utilization protein B